MAKENSNTDYGAFRMPNSIIQGLITTTEAGLNQLSVFEIVTMFGLMALVDQKHPDRCVRVRPSDILEIIQVGRSAVHVVDRQWTTDDGVNREKKYQAKRFKPRHRRQVNDALLTLFNLAVVIRHHDKDKAVEERIVHILDTFGYRYEVNGRALDEHDLPADRERVNVGTEDRPVWKIKRHTRATDQFDRPSAIVFRINKELAHEIQRRSGTISCTIFARRVFELFRQFSRNPAAVRLLILVLRQTQSGFTRILSGLLDDLGWDATHPTRAIGQLEEALTQLQKVGVATSFEIDIPADRVVIFANSDWPHQPSEA